jgi:predicted permease
MGRVLLGDFCQDVRYGLRSFRRSPGSALLVVVTLGLGIGANAAIFSLVDAVLLRPMPVQDPGGLVLLSSPTTKGSQNGGPGMHDGAVEALTEPLFRELAAHKEHFQGLAAETGAEEIPVGVDQPPAGAGVSERASIKVVTANYFDVLGVKAALGRTFLPGDETAPGADPVLVLSHAYWRRRFGGNPAIAGQRLQLAGRAYTVVGVAARGFDGMQLGTTVDLWAPLTMQPALTGKSSRLGSHQHWWLMTLGRLQPGVSRAAAEGSATAILHSYMAAHTPGWPLVRIRIHDGGSGFIRFRRGYSEPLWILMAGVGLLMLIVCLNVAHLLLARGLGRRQEIAIRRALGAGQARLTRQLLTEAFLLVAAGAAAGALVGSWLRDGLLSLAVSERAQLALAGGGAARVWSFTAVLALLTGLFIGLVPAWRATHPDLQQPLRAAAGAVGRGARPLLSRLLLSSQVAGSLVLLVGAGLLAGSLGRLRHSDKGFSEEPLLVAELDARGAGIRGPEAFALGEEMLGRLQAVPGVRSASLAKHGPLTGSTNCFIVVPGHDVEMVHWEVVTPGFFETMGIPLLGGRGFTTDDRTGAPQVVVVNETWARRFFGAAGAASAVGARFRYDPVRDRKMGDAVLEVVGVVRDARTETLTRELEPLMYLPTAQFPESLRHLQVRATAGLNPALLAGHVREVVSNLRPNLTVAWVRTMRGQVDQKLMKERLLATLSIAFGLCALFLVSVGLYGVISQWAAQRTPEMGLRMALGATGTEVRVLVMRQAFALVLAGVVVGLPAAVAAAHLFRSVLFGVSPVEPRALLLGVLLLGAVAALAAYLPARRASRTSPMAALRAE